MKKGLLVSAIAILIVGSYFFYQKRNHPSSALQKFIPDNTLLLLETNAFNHPTKSTVLNQIPLLSDALTQFTILQKIGFSTNEISALLTNKVLYFAVIPAIQDNLCLVNYLPLTDDDEAFINKLEALRNQTSGSRIIRHKTKGYLISEVIDNNAKPIFAFTIQNNFLIFSSSSLLVEEAILHDNNTWSGNLKLSILPADSDSIITATHFNTNALGKFIRKISLDKNVGHSYLSELITPTLNWEKASNNILKASGQTASNSIASGQKAKMMECLNLIPNSSSYMAHFAFSDYDKFVDKIQQNIAQHESLMNTRKSVSSAFDVDFEDIYEKLTGEIALISFEVPTEINGGKVVIIKNKALLDNFKEIAQNVAKEGEESTFNVKIGSFSVTSLGLKEFPSLLFGAAFGGFEESFFTVYNDYIIIGNSYKTMQEYLLSLTKGDVWSNSAKNQAIIKHCKPANITLICENAKTLTNLERLLTANWVQKIGSHEDALKRIQATIFQSDEEESSMVLLKNINPIKSPKKFANKWLKISAVALSAKTPPLYLQNPTTKNAEILVQTSDNNLCLFNNNKKIWHHQLAGKLVGAIKPLKFFNNNQYQYLAVTNRKVYILERTEKGFDVTPTASFKGFDLDNYTILEHETDHNSTLTLLSANGESFKINRNTLEVSSAFHKTTLAEYLAPSPSLIIEGTEYVAFFEKNGKLTLQNAKGKIAQGFPITLSGIFDAAPVLENINNNLVIRALSQQGELYKISIVGKVLEKKQLFRPDSEVKFSLCNDERTNDWILMRTDGKNTVIMDKIGNELFEIKEVTYGKKVVKYYHLGVGGKFFALSNGYTTYNFYNQSGEYIGGLPIVSQTPPVLTYSDSYNKLIINITSPSTLETWSVKLR